MRICVLICVLISFFRLPLNLNKLSTKQLIERKGDLTKLKTSPRNEVYLILDNIRSMYNVGAIFRTADAARIKKLYLCGITATPPRKEIEKTALKTIDYVPWEYIANLKLKIKKLKQEGIQIVGLEQTDQFIDYRKFDYAKPVAIIIGNEVDGISQEILDLCDAVVEIPMQGIANSLNVATAAGIILFEAIQ